VLTERLFDVGRSLVARRCFAPTALIGRQDGTSGTIHQVVNTPLVDFYRCPESFIDFALAGAPSSQSTYFGFGKELVCFGRSCGSSSNTINGNKLADLSEGVTWDGSTLRLPFDPSDIVENLRRERYATNGHASKRPLLSRRLVQEVYYALRPLLGVSVRKHLQRLFLRDWDSLPFPRWPVDTTVEQLMEKLLSLSMKARGIERVPFIWFWPDGALSCAIVTHDVDTKAGCELIPRLMEIDTDFDVKASFQLIPEGLYKISNTLVDGIRSAGFEVNLHDLNHDGNLFDGFEKFLARAQSINRYAHAYSAQGFRSGRLYRNADWYEALDVSYDMSIPNVAHLDPQRGGCCTVFPYYIGRTLELPVTTVQDYSLFHILGDYSVELWKSQIRLIMRKHGLASFIIHPDYSLERPSLAVYRTLLGYLADLRDEGDLWIALPQDVNHWWRQRSQMTLFRENGRWRVRGDGSERARVACAKLVGDRLDYALDEPQEGDAPTKPL